MNPYKIVDMLEYEGNVCSYLCREMTGAEFRKLFKSHIFVKLTNNEEEEIFENANIEEIFENANIKDKYRIIGGVKWGDYLNIDISNITIFNTTNSDKSKGIYFTNSTNAWRQLLYQHSLEYMRNIIIPVDAKIYIDSNGFRTDRLILCPKKKIPREIYVKAIKQPFRNLELKWVPIELRDREMCMAALDRDITNLQYFPPELFDDNTCMELVKLNEVVLKYIPLNVITKEVCIEAVRTYGYAIEYVPLNILDKNICIEAVKQNGLTLDLLPLEFIDKEICVIAVQQYDGALVCVPNEFIDVEMCKLSVKRNSNNIRYVPSHIRNKYF